MSSKPWAVAQILQKMFNVTPTLFDGDTRAVADPVYDGGDLDDLTTNETFNAVVDHTYVIKISTAAGTDKFQLSTDGGDFGAEVSITGSAQTIANGLTITFAATTGHTLGDTWTIVCTAGTAINAESLMNIAQSYVGVAVTLYVYDGQGTPGTPGTLIYKGATANWVNGRNDALGYALTSGVAYVVVTVTTTDPLIIIGTN